MLPSQYHPSALGSILGLPGSQGGLVGLCAAAAPLRDLYSCAALLVEPKKSLREGCARPIVDFRFFTRRCEEFAVKDDVC